MQSNELRLGNYVSVISDVLDPFLNDHGLEGIDNAFKVVSVDSLNVNISIDGLECELSLNDLGSIPLTEDCLVKFGFERTKKTFVDGAYAVTFSRNKDGGWAIYDTSIDEGTNYLTPNLGFCEHVHQLQNLYFALTGEELTIKE